MSIEIQRAQDMINGMQAQRDNALNTVVMLQADLAAARRTIKELTEMRAQFAATEAPNEDKAASELPE